MKIVRVDATPNPNAFKFILDEPIMRAGSRHYDAPPSHDEDPFAASIFEIPGVASVFFMENFVSLTTNSADVDWRGIEAKLGELVARCRPVSSTPSSEPAAASSAPELLGRIETLLDEYVRPALAGDGGGLQVLGLEGRELIIRYQGACGTCPSAINGTLFAIQNLIRQELDLEIDVIPG